MSFSTGASLSQSPVSASFGDIQWDSMEKKLKLSTSDKAALRAAEANPLDYTLAEPNETIGYANVLLKVLTEASGPRGPSSKVSKVKGSLSDEEALQMLNVDAMGVVTHYVITKLYEVVICLKEKKEKSAVTIGTTFYDASGVLLENCWRPLLRVLHLGGSGDAFTQRGAALCLGCILMAACPSQKTGKTTINLLYSSVEEPLRALVSWIASQLQSSSSTSISLVTPTLLTLMNCSEARIIFADSGGIGYLSKHLRRRSGNGGASSIHARRGATSVQQVYELCFCLWTMTYECNTSTSTRSHFARGGAVPALVDLVTTAPREKIVRVSLSSLRNLATISTDSKCLSSLSSKRTCDGTVFLTEMIGCGLLKSIDLMKERQWTDPDIVDDLNVLHRLLHENYREMSRWDVYKAEVESGHLMWGICHTEKFFKENARNMEGPDSDFAILKVLIKHTLSDDEDVVAISCFDIGEFVRHYPNGRSIAKRLGAKKVVMQLIEHENAEVQRHALQCVSKMMVQNWEFIS